MMKFNDRSERKLTGQNGFSVAQTTLKRLQRTKINQQTIIKNYRKIKNNSKVKAMGNITPTMDPYPRNG